MATQKPISTISYNTEEFLKEKLESWLKAHIIQTYMYICHKGEDGDKDHIHLRIEPNKKLDPMNLADELKQYVYGSEKPLCCRPFRPSKEEDWFLYVVHDKDYLRIKYGGGEKGEKLPYKWQNIVVPDDYDCEIAFIRAKAKLEHTTSNLTTRIRSGSNPSDLLLEGENPYTINAIVHALSATDYKRLAADYSDLQEKYYRLLDAIDRSGHQIEADKDGNMILVKVGEKYG